MIKIFDANDKDFSSAGNIIIEPIKCNEIKKKSLNGWWLDVEVPIKYAEYISKDKLCVVQTKSKLKPQAFRIGKEIQRSTRRIKFKAEHVMFDARDYALIDVRPTNQNGLNALNHINERTDEVSPFIMHSNVESINTAYFIRKNLLEAWTTIEERWGGVFDADNWDISFLISVGNDNGETIAYGKNMQGFDIYEDWSSVCTKLCPVGYDGLMLSEQFLISDVQYEKPYTRIIDFQTDLEEEEKTEENLLKELRTKGNAYLEENKIPKVSYTIISNINDKLEIGDTIKVLHPYVNIFTEVLEYEYNLISRKVISLTFGNYSRDVKTKFDNIKNTITQINQVISKQEVAINNQTNLINSLNKNGYVYIDDNEILILDALPKEKAKNVWRFGLGGIGFSSNGYEGPFGIAMTMDGQINADFITTGKLSVSRIEGLANFINETEKQISNIEIQQGNITSRVEAAETSINNITNTTSTAEGKNIHITDSAEEPLVDISLHGETNQATRSGKNLLNVPSEYTLTGTAWNIPINMPIGTYTLSVEEIITDGTIDSFLFYFIHEDDTIVYQRLTSETKTVTFTTEKVITKLNIYSQNDHDNSAGITTTYKNLMISTQGGEYEEYGATPSPEFPSEIENIEGNIAVKVIGKNLADFKIVSNQYNSSTELINNNVVKTTRTIANNISYSQVEVNLQKGKKYTVYVDIKGTNTEGSYVALWKGYNANGAYSNNMGNLYTFEAIQDLLILGLYSARAESGLETTFTFMILEGEYTQETISVYEPYKEQIAYFPLSEGQKLMEGSYLADDGIHNKRTQIILNGTENIVDYGNNLAYYIDNISPKGYTNPSKDNESSGIGKCSHLTWLSNSRDIDKSIRFQHNNGNRLYILLKDTNVTELKAWLQANPITVEYQLAKEEIIPYTAEQQEAWNKIKALKTYKNVTNITSDAYAKIVYMRDNGLDVYETKQNAEKQYTETTKKIAEQKITVDGILSQVSEASSSISSINNDLTEVKETVSSNTQRVNEYEIKFEEKTKTIDKDLQENIETVKSMSYKFNTDDLQIAKENDPVHARINNTGMRVYSYSDLKLISNHNGTGTQKLIVVGSAQLANLQIVKEIDENGQPCTDFHHLVSNIQKLEDLEV